MWLFILQIYLIGILPIMLLSAFVSFTDEARYSYNIWKHFWRTLFEGIFHGFIIGMLWPFFLLCFIILFCGYILTMTIDVIQTIKGR